MSATDCNHCGDCLSCELREMRERPRVRKQMVVKLTPYDRQQLEYRGLGYVAQRVRQVERRAGR